MPKVHSTVRGKWVACAADTRACPRTIHLPDVTPAQVALIPEHILEQLIEVVDPPTIVKAKNGNRVWMQNGRPGRDHDLPAIIDGRGSRTWYLNGQIGRLDDKPAEVFANGTMRWYQHGREGRAADRPSMITPKGQLQWKRDDQLHREGGKPAQINLNALAVYLRHGKRTFPAIHRLPDGQFSDSPHAWMTSDEYRRHGNEVPFSWWEQNSRRNHGRMEINAVLSTTRTALLELPPVLRENQAYAIIFDQL